MKRIHDYRKLLGVSKDTTLTELKSIYRNLMKEWHPDKFVGDEIKRLEAEEKSKKIISGYHFLISILPETVAQNKAEYLETLEKSSISDFDYKNSALIITFSDGISYEYLGVSKSIYDKLVNADAKVRFAKRHIYHAFIYRKLSNAKEE